MSNAIKKAKAPYNRRLIEKSGNDHKAFWRTLKKVCLAKERLHLRTFVLEELCLLTKKLIADSFNKFFTSSVTRLLKFVRSSCGSGASPSPPAPSRHYPDFKFAEVSEAYVRSQQRGLKLGKAVGLDAFWLIPQTLWPNL